jgi:hypothetical protein
VTGVDVNFELNVLHVIQMKSCIPKEDEHVIYASLLLGHWFYFKLNARKKMNEKNSLRFMKWEYFVREHFVLGTFCRGNILSWEHFVLGTFSPGTYSPGT